jgi:hypothetical protein
MKNITLTEEQAKLTLQAIDVAIKAGGINSASILMPVAFAIDKQLQSVENAQTPE